MNNAPYLGGNLPPYGIPPYGPQKKSANPAVKIALIVLALILGFTFIRGCYLNRQYQRRTVDFSEMEYKRPDVDGFFDEVDALIKEVKRGKDINKVWDHLEKVNLMYSDYLTQSMLCYVRYSIDTKDKFYLAEQDFFDQQDSLVDQKLEDFFYAAAASDFRDQLEKDSFGEGFFDSYEGESLFNEAVVALMQEEARLSNEYSRLMADPTVEFEGKEESYFELMSSGNLSETQIRELVDQYYTKYNQLAAEIYIKLIPIRKQIAANLGYDSYAQYCFDNFGRSYSPEKADEYCRLIEKHLAPLYRQLIDNSVMEYYSQVYSLSEKELWKFMEGAVSEIGGDVEEAYNFMRKYSLCDLSDSPTKVSGAYTTYLYDYDAPIIVAHPYGTSEDLMTVAHEFGHFCDYYVNYGSAGGVDLSECASQGMEFLILSNLDSVMRKEDADYLLASKLLTMLETVVDKSRYHQFESRVYALETSELTVEAINAISEDCFGDLGWYGDGFEIYIPLSWIGVNHFFTAPFYTISYSLSADVAFQIYSQEQAGKGLKTYLSLLNGEEKQDFTRGIKAAGLADPFTEKRVLELKSIFENNPLFAIN